MASPSTFENFLVNTGPILFIGRKLFSIGVHYIFLHGNAACSEISQKVPIK